MERGNPEISDETAEALGKLVDVISHAALRKTFTADPVGTLRGEGVEVEHIPQPVLDTLAELSYEELGVMARVNESLLKSGLRKPGIGIRAVM